VRRGFLCGRANDMQDVVAAIVAAVLAIVVAFQIGGDQ
jgi:VanZ family protein